MHLPKALLSASCYGSPTKVAAKRSKTNGHRANSTNGALSRLGAAHVVHLKEGSQQEAILRTVGNSRAARSYRLPHVPPVEAVGLEERAASLAKRSIKKESKVEGLKLTISMMDLTTLEGKDTPGKVVSMCRKAQQPMEQLRGAGNLGDIPSCAAVCVYPNLVAVARRALAGSTVKIASVATAFPSGQSPLAVKLDDVRRAVGFGADEIDMVIDRGAFLRGDYGLVFDEIARTKEACGGAHLKVILETGELGTYDNVRLASAIAIDAGADFIKTSTGKVQPAATLPVTLLMLEAIRDHEDEGGRRIGMKPAGGVRTAKQALQYLCVVNETLGPNWLTPDLFRFGASALLNDVLMQLEKERTGAYSGEDYFSKD
ncbi:MAG: deoxyribose-phosphate aldolase [Polyangiales bacterium]